MTRARGVVFVGPRRVEVRPVDLTDGGLLVRTRISGISGGTESLAFRGEIDPDTPLDETIGALTGTFRYPFRYGYGCVGEVERGAGGVAAGTTVFAFHPHQDVFAADPASVVRVDGVDHRVATMFPLVETALQIALDAGRVGDEEVVVFGLGAVGLLATLILERHGARVLGVEPSSSRRALAATAGVRAVEPGSAPDAVAEVTEGRGVSLAVECSGNPAAPGLALPVLAHEGTLLVASWFGTKEVTLPLGGPFHRRRLTIRSTQVSSIPAALPWSPERRRAAARDLLDRLPLKLLATHEFAFEEAQRAFESVDRGGEVLHAALRYP